MGLKPRYRSQRWGRILDSDYSRDSECCGEIHCRSRTLDRLSEDLAMSVYCSCGRIVILDKREMSVKLELSKELECMKCRNIRISREIDEINNHFLGIVDEDACYN